MLTTGYDIVNLEAEDPLSVSGNETVRIRSNGAGSVAAAGSFTGENPVILSSLNIDNVIRNGVGDYTVTLAAGISIPVSDRAVTTDAASPADSHYDHAGSTPTTIHILVTDSNGLPADALTTDFICVRTIPLVV